MNSELSKIRLYSMRFLFLLTGVTLGYPAWSTLIGYGGTWDPTHGIAFSFWGAFSALAFVGVFFPVKMLPLLLLQFLYKLTWVLAVGYPLWVAGQLDETGLELMKACGFGVIIDVLIIPWVYVFKHYFKASPTQNTA